MKTKMSSKQMESIVIEIIEFLIKWGLWEDVSILANGNAYEYAGEENVKYKELSNVEFTENVNVDDYESTGRRKQNARIDKGV